MSTIIKYLATAIIGAAICFFLVKSCDKSDVVIAKYQDSIKRRDFLLDSNTNESNKILSYSNSVVKKSLADSAWHKHRDDSLMSDNKRYKSLYAVAKDSTLTLWGQLKIFYESGDTIGLRIAYYELRDELDSLNNLVNSIQFRDEAIEYNLRNDADSAHATVRILNSKLDALKSLLDQQTQIAEQANAEEGKILATQKKKKIWGIIKDIGIGLAGIFAGSKFK